MTINVHKNKQRSCKRSKIVQKNSWILNTQPNGVTHLIMPFIDDKTPQNGFFKNILPQKTLDL